MINPQHIYAFCEQMRVRFGAGFTQTPLQRGFKVIGEYYTRTGQLLSIVLTVTKTKVETRIYDASRRMIFSNSSTGDINRNIKVISFIERSVNQY